ncbi:MAG: lipopolysaccharide biosynthesis protein [Gammaproteobacteria bacterium]|nr:lipopolysaccharide biosynthesis protein [Gammaproteobacteria bacterium]
MSETLNTPDFSDYIAAIKRRRLLLVSIGLPILAIALALAIGLPDVYVSTGLITFSDATVSGQLPTDKERASREKSYMDQYVASLSESVMSARSLTKLVKDVPEAVPADGTLEDAMKDINRKTRVETVKMPVLDPDSSREREIISAFTVQYGSRNPEIAQKASAWLTNQFMVVSRGNLLVRAKAAAQFYNVQAEQYRKDIADLESKLAIFKAKNFGNLPELTDLNLNLLDRTQRDLDDIGQQQRALRQDKIFLEQQLVQARNAGTDEGMLQQLQAEYSKKLSTYDENHPDMIALRRQIDAIKAGGGAIDSLSLSAQLQAQKQILAQARQRYSEDHPDVKRIERQIKTLQTRIASGEVNAGNVVGSPAVVQLKTQINAMDTQIAGLDRRAGELRTKLDTMERRVEQTPQTEREYKTLTRDLEVAHAKYDEINKSMMDSELTSAAITSGRSDELSLVQAPSVPAKPAKPKRVAIAAIGVMLAILLSLTAVVVAESVDQTVRGSRDVRRVLDLSPLGVIPEIQDAVSARRARWRMATLTACVVVASTAIVVTVRNFY